jgi:phage/plasmid primase-like uncharacterized protein
VYGVKPIQHISLAGVCTLSRASPLAIKLRIKKVNEFKFRNECLKHLGYTIDLKNIPAIGKISRFNDKNKKQHNLNGWIANIDGNIFKIGSWSTQESFCYVDNKHQVERVSPEQKKILRDKYREASFVAERERNEAYLQAAKKAEKELTQMAYITNYNQHDYLIKKWVDYSAGMRIHGDRLYIPIYNSYTGELQSYQSIDSQGKKMFLKGGKKEGGCYPVNDIEEFDVVILCEGYATGSSINTYHQALEFQNKFHERPYTQTTPLILCCFDAGNLLKVAKNIRSKYLDIPIEVWADNDKNGVGIQKAKEVKKNVSNVSIYYPKLSDNDINNGLSDYNDLIRNINKNGGD